MSINAISKLVESSLNKKENLIIVQTNDREGDNPATVAFSGGWTLWLPRDKDDCAGIEKSNERNGPALSTAGSTDFHMERIQEDFLPLLMLEPRFLVKGEGIAACNPLFDSTMKFGANSDGGGHEEYLNGARKFIDLVNAGELTYLLPENRNLDLPDFTIGFHVKFHGMGYDSHKEFFDPEEKALTELAGVYIGYTINFFHQAEGAKTPEDLTLLDVQQEPLRTLLKDFLVK